MRNRFSLIIKNKLIQCLMLGSLTYLMLCSAVRAQEMAINNGEIRISPGQSQIIDLAKYSQKETTILLDIVARLDADVFSGSNYFMKVVLNGREVNPAKTRMEMRLKNKSFISPVAPNKSYKWFDNSAWRILYAPDFTAALKIGFNEGNPYQTVLDVTDLVNPADENRLELFNTCKENLPSDSKGNYDLVIHSLTIHVKPEVSELMATTAVDVNILNRGTPGAGPLKYVGKIMPGGGFNLSFGNHSMDFSSYISYPNAGLNKLGSANQPPSVGQPGFKVFIKHEVDGGQVIAVGPDYQIVRTVRFTPRKVEVYDQITNLHQDSKLGLFVENMVDLKDVSNTVRLAGNPSPWINEYFSHGNPSVYIMLPNAGLGMLCEDDIYRNQAILFFDSNKKKAGLRTDKLCLPARGTYTLQWSVYPVASNDYYDFINLVRHDWDSNYTVEGAWTFFSPDSIIDTPIEKIRERFMRLGIKRACTGGGWVDIKHDRKRIGYGSGVFDGYWADYRDRLRRAAEKIRIAVPDCKVYVYFDTQRDTSENGPECFKDSWLTDENGNQVSKDWDGKYNRAYNVIATHANSFGKAMLSVAEKYLKEMMVDGLYWDEMEGVRYGQPLLTYNASDGYSCELDPVTYSIKREIGINTIMGEKHRIAVIKKVRELGGDIMGNGPISTKNILALKPQRMTEIQHNDYWHYEGNLGSPLGYAASRTEFGNWVRALDMATLLVGTRYNYAYVVERYVFPFTPIELHAGYLLGKERIIATHSGNYGWPDEKNLCQTYFFDCNGKLTKNQFKTEIFNEALTEVEIDKDEAVVLVKLPVSITPVDGKITIYSVKYTPERLNFIVEANKGCSIEVRAGEMPVRAGQMYNVKIGSHSNTMHADSNDVLRISLGVSIDTVGIEILPL